MKLEALQPDATVSGILPTVTVRMLREMRKYSTDRSSAKVLAGTMQTFFSASTMQELSNALGSTIEFMTFV